MVFRLMLGDVEIGRSALDSLDDGMAVATGSFAPSPGYESIAPLFRAITDAIEARAAAVQLLSARDALDLRLLGPDGAQIPVDFVTVYDFGETLDRELEVKLADVAAWQHARAHSGAG
jgi:hypothetical protein